MLQPPAKYPFEACCAKKYGAAPPFVLKVGSSTPVVCPAITNLEQTVTVIIDSFDLKPTVTDDDLAGMCVCKVVRQLNHRRVQISQAFPPAGWGEME